MKTKSLPSYNAILRLKRAYARHGLPDSQLHDILRSAYKKRGGYWVRSQLSWYI